MCNHVKERGPTLFSVFLFCSNPLLVSFQGQALPYTQREERLRDRLAGKGGIELTVLEPNKNKNIKIAGNFASLFDIFFPLLFMFYVIKHCFICRPSVYAKIEPRIAASLALTAGCSNHSRLDPIPFSLYLHFH